MEITLFTSRDGGTDSRFDRKPYDLKYTNDVVLLTKDPIRLYVFLDRLKDSAWCIIHFPGAKYCNRTGLPESELRFNKRKTD